MGEVNIDNRARLSWRTDFTPQKDAARLKQDLAMQKAIDELIRLCLEREKRDPIDRFMKLVSKSKKYEDRHIERLKQRILACGKRAFSRLQCAQLTGKIRKNPELVQITEELMNKIGAQGGS